MIEAIHKYIHVILCMYMYSVGGHNNLIAVHANGTYMYYLLRTRKESLYRYEC